MNKSRRLATGFTLIELLVVIAIIGILSAVVLTSLNAARSKGNLAEVQQNMAHIRAQAEIDYSTVACYSTGTCTAASTGSVSCPMSVATYPNTIFADQQVISMITVAASHAGAITSCISNTNANSYAVSMMYPNDTTHAWCVDSSGNSRSEAVASPYGQAQVDGTYTVVNGKEVCK